MCKVEVTTSDEVADYQLNPPSLSPHFPTTTVACFLRQTEGLLLVIEYGNFKNKQYMDVLGNAHPFNIDEMVELQGNERCVRHLMI